MKKSYIENIKSSQVLEIISNIKKIQKRMKDNDIKNLSYIETFDTLSKEFQEFSENYTLIFTKIIRGDNLETIAQALYYKDKVEQNLISESELSEILANKYLPPELKKKSDEKINEMKNKKQI